MVFGTLFLLAIFLRSFFCFCLLYSFSPGKLTFQSFSSFSIMLKRIIHAMELTSSKCLDCRISSTYASWLFLTSNLGFVFDTLLKSCYRTEYVYGATQQCVLPKPTRSIDKNIEKCLFSFWTVIFRWKEVLLKTTFNCSANWVFTGVEKVFLNEITAQSLRAPKEVLIAKKHHSASKISFELSAETLFQPNDALRLI